MFVAIVSCGACRGVGREDVVIYGGWGRMRVERGGECGKVKGSPGVCYSCYLTDRYFFSVIKPSMMTMIYDN